MPVVPASKLEPGMVLAKPLTRGAMVLLGAGTVLTEAWISRIDDMGVEYIHIDGPAVQAVPIEEALAQLDLRFRNVEESPYMKEIKAIARMHIEGLYG